MRTGRPRLLTPDQERRVYETVSAARLGQRIFVCTDLARELGVGVSTVQRILTQQRRSHWQRIVSRFHEEPQKSTGEPNA